MKTFPERLPLPETVMMGRVQRQKELLSSAWCGIGIRSAIILFELIGVWLFASSSLLLDAIASSIDVISSLFLILCIKLADRPPDTNHPFGHGRYEPLVGLQLGIMLLVVGAYLFVQQIFQATSESHLQNSIDHYAWIFPVIAVVLLEICYQIVMRTALRQNSPALAADALHYRVDGLTSLFAAIALILGAFLPEWSHLIDHVGAVFIAFFMVLMGGYAAFNNLHQLMDRIPDKVFFDRVRKAACRAEGVRDTEKIGIQVCGPDAHVDIDIEVDPHLTVEVAHKISQEVRIEIQKEWPAVRDVIVHIEPYYPNDH